MTEAVLFHVVEEDVEALFALAAADELADAGNEQIHGGDGAVVIVDAHVERFDFLGIVEDGDRAFQMLFGKIALMFRLQIDAELDGVFEGFAGLLERVDGVFIAEALEGCVGDGFEALQEGFVDELIEECEVIAAFVESSPNHGLDEFFRHIDVAMEIGECHFWFDHPELGGMARGVGILGAKCGAEGVNVAEPTGEGFGFELPGNGQECLFGEEVFLGGLFVDVAVEGGDAEQFARAFAVARGDDGCVDVDEILFLEKAVDGERDARAEAECGSEEIGARTEVGDAAEELGGVTFFLKWVVVWAGAYELEPGGVHFPLLAFPRGFDEISGDDDTRSGGGGGELAVARNGFVDNDLDALDGAAVVDFEEGEFFRVTFSTNPPFDGNIVESGG